mmetsp:Transcript_65098/g.155445  ORF Transcript_65098/g.155445 Transcript_65098/m.155445 type:complete len:307 (+) Transcript_65098:542-1462(+)
MHVLVLKMALAQMVDFGVRLVRLQIGEEVICVAMTSFVCSNLQKDVAHHGFFGKIVVLARKEWSLHVGKHWKLVSVDGIDKLGVSDDSLLLEVADKTMTVSGADEVHQTVPSEKHPLTCNDNSPEDRPRTSQIQCDQEMHALIFGLCKQGMYPAVISAHETQRMQMTHHTRHHTWNSCHCFQEDHTTKPIPLVHGPQGGSEFVAREEVEAGPEGPHSHVRCPVNPVSGLPVRGFNRREFVAGPAVCCDQMIEVERSFFRLLQLTSHVRLTAHRHGPQGVVVLPCRVLQTQLENLSSQHGAERSHHG